MYAYNAGLKRQPLSICLHVVEQLLRPKPLSKIQSRRTVFNDLAEKRKQIPLAPSAFHMAHTDSSRRELPVPRVSAPQV